MFNWRTTVCDCFLLSESRVHLAVAKFGFRRTVCHADMRVTALCLTSTSEKAAIILCVTSAMSDQQDRRRCDGRSGAELGLFCFKNVKE